MASPKDRLAKTEWQEKYRRINIKLFKIFNFSIKWIFRYSGLEFIYRKFNPPQNPQTLPTGFIWLIGIYVAFFGLASQRYENRIEIIENRANSVFAQLAVPSLEKKALSRIPMVQNMPCPYKPNILNPLSVFISLSKDSKYAGVSALLQETIEDWKDSLASVKLSEAILRAANLRDANLKGADLSKADLQEAILQQADLQNANLRGAILRRADLRRADLQEAILQEADFQNANLRGANLQRADLRRANLQQADFQNANLRGANFQNTNLREANLQRASLLGADLQRAFLRKADFQYTNLWGADLRRADLRDADLRRAGLQNTNLREANLQGADLRDAFLQRADLRDTFLQEADFQGANLRGANLQGADLAGAKKLTVEQLCKASTLYETKLDQELKVQLKLQCSDLLKKPQTTKENTSGEKKVTP
jgi:uncharacterized protein YjbI with pentapeptide repeats